ncbi:MAG TPA: helix-turn-helix domain-containing protein [Actinomycetaceae bacterium]|nr:helix-turn-helix domain-containing protein [Actinomycetaceae bacterium]
MTILDAFTIEAPFLSLGEIAARAGMPPSTAHGIVAELVAEGLLERMADRSYRVGTRLWEIGSRTPGVLGLREIALPVLHGVQAAIRQHVQLAVHSGLDVLIIERLSARDAVVNASIVGGRIPLEHSSSGHVLLAHLEDDLVPQIVGLARPSPITGRALQEEELRGIVRRVRQAGYAVAEGYIHEASRGIAVPVHGAQGVVVAALGLVVANDGSSPAPLVSVLRRAAASLSDALRRSYLPSGHPRAGPGGSYRRMVHSSDRSMQYLEDHAGTEVTPARPAPPGGPRR